MIRVVPFIRNVTQSERLFQGVIRGGDEDPISVREPLQIGSPSDQSEVIMALVHKGRHHSVYLSIPNFY